MKTPHRLRPARPRPPTHLVAIALATLVATALFAVANAVAQDAGVSVTFDDQTSGGTLVHVQQVTLPDGGFVVLHDQTLANDALVGSIVGASDHLAPGTHNDVTVLLSEPLSATTTLTAMPHRDTDGDRVYSFISSTGGTDGAYTDNQSMVAIDDAVVTVSAALTFEDQRGTGDSVLVDRVELAAGGFVAIHGPGGDVAGHSSFLGPGVHDRVRVPLDGTGNQTATLTAMPHRDTDADQTYDFGTSNGADDGPYTNDADQAVTAEARVTFSNEATVTFAAQSTGGHAVVVDSAFLPDGGFVTIHDQTLASGDALGSVIGVSDKLAPGTHKHLLVPLDDTPADDSTLTAMPHHDSNDNDRYDFVTSDGADDGPLLADTGAVVHAAPVTIPEEGGEPEDGGDRAAGPDDGAPQDTDTDDNTGTTPAPGWLALLVITGAALAVARRRRG